MNVTHFRSGQLAPLLAKDQTLSHSIRAQGTMTNIVDQLMVSVDRSNAELQPAPAQAARKAAAGAALVRFDTELPRLLDAAHGEHRGARREVDRDVTAALAALGPIDVARVTAGVAALADAEQSALESFVAAVHGKDREALLVALAIPKWAHQAGGIADKARQLHVESVVGADRVRAIEKFEAAAELVSMQAAELRKHLAAMADNGANVREPSGGAMIAYGQDPQRGAVLLRARKAGILAEAQVPQPNLKLPGAAPGGQAQLSDAAALIARGSR